MRASKDRVADGATWEWRRSTEEADALINTLAKSQWTEVRYEDLCSRPKEILCRLFQFINLKPTLAPTRFIPEEKHIIGNGMRFDSALEVHLDDRWKSILDTHELRTFDEIAGSLNRRLGYA